MATNFPGGHLLQDFVFLSFQLQAQSDWAGVRKEVDLASRHVRQLGSLLFEMEVLRSYLEPHELPYFDARVIPAKTSALVAIHGLQGKN